MANFNETLDGTKQAYSYYSYYYRCVTFPLPSPYSKCSTKESTKIHSDEEKGRMHLRNILARLSLDNFHDETGNARPFKRMFRDYGFKDFSPIVIEICYSMLRNDTKCEMDLLRLLLTFLTETVSMSSGYGIKIFRTNFYGTRWVDIIVILIEHEDAGLGKLGEQMQRVLIGRFKDIIVDNQLKENNPKDIVSMKILVDQDTDKFLSRKNEDIDGKGLPHVAGDYQEEKLVDSWLQKTDLPRNESNLKSQPGTWFLWTSKEWDTLWDQWFFTEKIQVIPPRMWGSFDFLLQLEKNCVHSIPFIKEHGVNSGLVALEIKRGTRDMRDNQEMTAKLFQSQGNHYFKIFDFQPRSKNQLPESCKVVCASCIQSKVWEIKLDLGTNSLDSFPSGCNNNNNDNTEKENSDFGTHGQYGKGSKQREQILFPSQPPYTAFVGNLPVGVTDGNVRQLFTAEKCKLRKTKITSSKSGKTIAYVTFEDLISLQIAIGLSGQISMLGRVLFIDVDLRRTNRESTWVQRRW